MDRHRGHVLLLAALLALAAAGAVAAIGSGALELAARRAAASERALAQARAALVSYAADRPIDAVVGPGYLPCPDLDDDGWAESTCGSLTGHLGQRERLGRLPWKTLGLPDLRDGHGERLWYAVSTRHKGLLHCAASRACVDMAPAAALGTITVRDASGRLLHDGRLADPVRGGAAAVVIAPGAALARADGHAQRRGCEPPACDARGHCVADPPWAAERCDPRNYLDAAPESRFAHEDNADFHDRSDAAGRGANGNGFVDGPVALADGRAAVNDRLAAVSVADLLPRVMARVALEAAQCLRAAAPPPDAPCDGSGFVGALPAAALAGAHCSARPLDPSWWLAWRPHVVYALAGNSGLEVRAADGAVVARGQRLAVLVTALPASCGAGVIACGPAGCERAARPPRAGPQAGALAAIP